MIRAVSSGMCESESRGLSELRERAVRTELNRLLESSAFRTSKRCREFLEHIVQHTISGPAGSLKERSIGVELFQLPQDFDTGQHTIVRVTANEVRKKLAQHYLAENGSSHAVKINLPPGSYSAEFKWQASPPPTDVPPLPVEAPATAPVPARARRLSGPVIACCTAALLIAGALGLWRSQTV